MEQNDLSKRLFEFAVRSIKFLRKFPNNSEYKVIRYQLIKSSTSAGANYSESQAATSKADFHNKVKIALREMRESNYWLRILVEIIDFNFDKEEMNWLIDESNQLGKILGTIANKTKK